MKKLLQIVLCISFVLTSCKKDINNENKTTETTQLDLKIEQNTNSCRDFKPNERKKYKENLEILKRESFYSAVNKHIDIKFPVEDKKYKIYKSIWFKKNNKKGLLICISNKKSNSIRGTLGNYILDKKIKFSKISGTNVNLQDKEELFVVVFNDDRFSKPGGFNAYKIIANLSFKEEINFFEYKNNPKVSSMIPEEAGGGIIIKKP